ncbi:hypothetical protein phiAS5_ORF0257 [Aeromonas phage phiAS5]|uniref:Uncharacterized protein n=1 Tax=Aeromonas phage phiAS5 TaxID=879630 RepID=E1A211_9CAUD|nr:hypothetical protein phiAS5_ORF0257 [Aeromonas phage phiAS5]ADM80100.1 hypothetical protein phiAS5_ORF0257 [Aeromonas phage phiAS5]
MIITVDPFELSVGIMVVAGTVALICNVTKHALARDSMAKSLVYINANLAEFGLSIKIDKRKYVITDGNRITRPMNAYDTEYFLKQLGEERTQVMDCFRIHSSVIPSPVNFMRKGD